jgi:hypothetical protein
MLPRDNLLLMLDTGGHISPHLLLLTAYFLPSYSQHFNVTGVVAQRARA